MKKKVILSLLLLLGGRTLAQQLYYDRPARYFEEAMVIGNGNLGAIIYGGVGENRISLNDITLWTGEPDTVTYHLAHHVAEVREALFQEDYLRANQLNRQLQGHYSENYQPLGWITIVDSTLTDSSLYHRGLDLDNAMAHDAFGSVNRSYFVSAPDSVIVIRLQGQPHARIQFHSLLPHTVVCQGDELIVDGYAAYHSLPHYLWDVKEKFCYDSTRGIHFRTIIKQVGDLVLVSNATSFNHKDYRGDVRARIDKAASMSFGRLQERHVEDYRSLYGRFDLFLGYDTTEDHSLPTDRRLRLNSDETTFNPALEADYIRYGRYLLISCSRTLGVPANLQGLWNEQILPPWSSNYTTNINVQENYWPAEISGLGSLHRQSLIEWIGRLKNSGERSARGFYGVHRGWCLGQNSDIWAMTNPVGLQEGDPSWACWTMGGAWLATHLWEHYAFSMDKDYLAEVYDVLKGAADFCIDWLVEKDGHLLTAPATSPENIFVTPQGHQVATLYGGTADLAIIRECLQDALSAARVLHRDARYCDTVSQVLCRLYPYQVGSDGTLQEWYHDWKDVDPQHRHQSHLFGLYPGHHISLSATPALAQACANTLAVKGDNTTGWSCGWRVNLYARLQQGENAYHMFRRLMRYVSPDAYQGEDKVSGGGTYPNMLDAHSPFQIDGNFGGTAGAIEMLAQSSLEHGVELLPALPERWVPQGWVRGLCVRGGFTVDFSWQDGCITSLTVHNNTSSRRNLTLRCQGKEWNVKIKAGHSKRVL